MSDDMKQLQDEINQWILLCKQFRFSTEHAGHVLEGKCRLCDQYRKNLKIFDRIEQWK